MKTVCHAGRLQPLSQAVCSRRATCGCLFPGTFASRSGDFGGGVAFSGLSFPRSAHVKAASFAKRSRGRLCQTLQPPGLALAPAPHPCAPMRNPHGDRTKPARPHGFMYSDAPRFCPLATVCCHYLLRPVQLGSGVQGGIRGPERTWGCPVQHRNPLQSRRRESSSCHGGGPAEPAQKWAVWLEAERRDCPSWWPSPGAGSPSRGSVRQVSFEKGDGMPPAFASRAQARFLLCHGAISRLPSWEREGPPCPAPLLSSKMHVLPRSIAPRQICYSHWLLLTRSTLCAGLCLIRSESSRLP